MTPIDIFEKALVDYTWAMEKEDLTYNDLKSRSMIKGLCLYIIDHCIYKERNFNLYAETRDLLYKFEPARARVYWFLVSKKEHSTEVLKEQCLKPRLEIIKQILRNGNTD